MDIISSEQLDAIALKKLVQFVNDLMEQYFGFVRRRVQLEVSCPLINKHILIIFLLINQLLPDLY